MTQHDKAYESTVMAILIGLIYFIGFRFFEVLPNGKTSFGILLIILTFISSYQLHNGDHK